MTVILMCVAGILLAMAMTVVIFSTTSNNSQLKELGVVSIRWAVVWLMLFMTFLYIHDLQQELETYKLHEQDYVQN